MITINAVSVLFPELERLRFGYYLRAVYICNGSPVVKKSPRNWVSVASDSPQIHCGDTRNPLKLTRRD